MEIIIYIASIILNVFLLKIVKKGHHKKWGTISSGKAEIHEVVLVFLPALGTFLLLMILLSDSGIFDYKSKK